MVSAGLRIVYFGTPAFAVPSLRRLMESRHQVVGVVSQPDRPKGRGQRVQQTPTKQVALERGVPVLQPERLKDVEFLDRLSALRPDLGVVAAYGKILPDVVLAVPPLGMINVHASILPKYRGAAPVHRAVMAGDSETGVTIMRVIRELDAGPTFAMQRRAIGEDETSVDVEAALADIGADLLLDVVEAMASGRSVETPQDDSKATVAPKLTKTEGRIDWTLPAAVIHNLVRGLHPWPLASTHLDAARLLIHRTQKVPATFLPRAETPSLGGGSPSSRAGFASARPGSVFVQGRSELTVTCGDGKSLRILEIQPEGGRVMTIRDFLAGHAIRPGAQLEAR